MSLCPRLSRSTSVVSPLIYAILSQPIVMEHVSVIGNTWVSHQCLILVMSHRCLIFMMSHGVFNIHDVSKQFTDSFVEHVKRFDTNVTGYVTGYVTLICHNHVYCFSSQVYGSCNCMNKSFVLSLIFIFYSHLRIMKKRGRKHLTLTRLNREFGL